MILQIIILSLLCLTLIYATNLVIISIKSIARRSGLGAYGITAFILAISTSLPELMVSIVASIEGNTSLILGNIIGSNIADLSLVIGGGAILASSLKVSGTILSRDIYLTGAAGFLPLLLIADGTLSRPDGIVLLVIYIVMVATFLKDHHQSLAQNALAISPFKRLLLTVTKGNGRVGIFKFILGISLLLLSSHFIVNLASVLAISTGLSTLFIGLFIVSVGTSLPELAFELKAISAGQTKMALGDLLGSIVANSTLILGLSALIRPIALSHAGLVPYGMAIGTFTIIYSAFIYFVKSKKKLEWWEGVILILIYVLFIFAELSNK